jgi:opacity protein-like surface antigen
MERVNFIASIGIGRLKAKVDDGDSAKKINFRLGAGAQYDFDQNIAVRAMLRYQKGSKKISVKSTVSANLAAIYAF